MSTNENSTAEPKAQPGCLERSVRPIKTAHFVTFLSPGTFVHEETTKPIESWDMEKAKQMARSIKERHAATPFAFVFTTRSRTDEDLDSKEVKRSGRYYLGGKIETLEDVRKRNDPNERILLSNMECNKWHRIIVNTNSWKITQPLEADDTVLDWPNIVIDAIPQAKDKP